jgi:large subunit ribosomal protein L15
MVRVHKRNKRTRLRGSRSGGYGFRKKHKGHGNKGGFGMSGTGKRGSQIQQKAYMMAIEAGFKSYFGKQGMTSASTQKVRTEQINLKDIKANLFQKDGQKIELKEHKILGDGEGFKAEIHAKAASASAMEKMEKAGGKIVLPVEKSDSKKEVSSEKTEDKKAEKSEGKKVDAKTEKKTPAKKK